MKQSNSILIAIILFFAGILGEAYVISAKLGFVPFLLCSIFILGVVAYLTLNIRALIIFSQKRRDSGKKGDSDSLYRLLESRLYNIERYQKAIYNENKSARVSLEELASAFDPSVKVENTSTNSGTDIDKLIVRQKAIMERMAKAIIKNERDNTSKLLAQLSQNPSPAPAPDGDFEKLGRILSSLEVTQKKLLHALENLNTMEAVPNPIAAAADEAAVSVSESVKEQDVPDTNTAALNAVLAEVSLEDVSDNDTIETEDSDVMETSSIIEEIPDITSLEDISMTAESSDDSPADGISDIDKSIENTEITKDENPTTEEALESLETLDVLETLDAADEEIPVFDEGLMSEEAIKELAASLNATSADTDETSDISAGDSAFDAEADLDSLLDEISMEEEAASALPDIDNKEAAPAPSDMDNEEAASASSDNDNDISNSTAALDGDPNRQLTPEEIAAMFASM